MIEINGYKCNIDNSLKVITNTIKEKNIYKINPKNIILRKNIKLHNYKDVTELIICKGKIGFLI